MRMTRAGRREGGEKNRRAGKGRKMRGVRHDGYFEEFLKCISKVTTTGNLFSVYEPG